MRDSQDSSETPERTRFDSALVHLREASRLLAQRPVSNLGTILALSLALLLPAFVTWSLSRAGTLTEALDADMQLHAPLDPSLDEPQTRETLLAISALPGVETVRWIGPKAQREALLSSLGEDLLAGLDDGVFPAGGMAQITLNRGVLVSSDDSAALRAKIASIAHVTGVSALPYDAAHIDILFKGASLIETAGVIVALLAVLSALLSTFLIIRSALRDNLDLIALLSAFGATPNFISTRFITLALSLGLAAALLTLALGVALESPLEGLVSLLPHHEGENAGGLTGLGFLSWSLIGGPSLALLGGLLALARHRREYL